MRAIVTGQVGVDKGPYLQAVQEMAQNRGIDLQVCNVGRMMYAEAPDVPPGRILNLPITRLNALRRAVFKEILRTAERHEPFAGATGFSLPSTSITSRRSTPMYISRCSIMSKVFTPV